MMRTNPQEDEESTEKPSCAGLQWLYYGDLAPDDFMWSLKAKITDCLPLLERPTHWVDHLTPPLECDPPQLQDRPGTVRGRERLRLVSPFTMQMSLAQGDNKTFLNEKVQIAGIGETGILRMVVSPDTAVPLSVEASRTLSLGLPSDPGDYYDSLLGIMQSHPPQDGGSLFQVIDDVQNGRWFGHLQIYDKAWFPEHQGEEERNLRVRWIAIYLVMRVANPALYVEFLERLNPEIVRIGPRDSQKGWSFEPSPDVSFAYFGAEESDDMVCDVVGGYDEHDEEDRPTYMVQNATVKNYKTPLPSREP